MTDLEETTKEVKLVQRKQVILADEFYLTTTASFITPKLIRDVVPSLPAIPPPANV